MSADETTTAAQNNNNEGDDAEEEVGPTLKVLSINIHEWIVDKQNTHGVRHDDYAQYHGYCTRRLSRIRHHEAMKKDLLHSPKYVAGTKKSSRHAFCKRIEETTLCTHVDHLWNTLVQAERAWAHAQCTNKSNHKIRRLAKAKKWANQLQSWAAEMVQLQKQNNDAGQDSQQPDPKVIEFFYKECQAYSGWITANWALEKRDYETACNGFAQAITICHELANTSINTENATAKASDSSSSELLEAKQLERHDLFTTRAETVLRPLFRYGQYELQQSTGISFPSPVIETLSSKGTSSDNNDDSAISFRNQDILLNNKQVQLLIWKLRSFLNQQEQQTTSAHDEELFLNILSTVDDTMQLVTSQLKQLQSGDDSNKATKGPLAIQQENNLKLTCGYLQWIKSHTMMTHYEQLLSQLPQDANPAERVHIYDALLQEAKNVVSIERPNTDNTNTTVGSNVYDDDDEFALQAQANVLRIRAFRSFYMAQYYFGNNRFKQAHVLMKHAQSLATNAVEEIGACDDDMSHKEKYIQGLETLLQHDIAGKLAMLEATLYLQSSSSSSMQQGSKKTNRCLLQRLSDWDSGETTTTSNNNTKLADVPLIPIPMPCKPVFYDVALDHAIDVSAPLGEIQNFIQEHTQPEKSATSTSSGGLLGWLTG